MTGSLQEKRGKFYAVLNFRDEENDLQRTYFMNIKNFINMCGKIGKKSFNEIDLIMNGAIKIIGEKKRKRYRWNIDKFLIDYVERKTV